jgi:hypothetical protein
MNPKNSSFHIVSASLVALGLLAVSTALRADAILTLVTPGTSNSTVTITPNSSFTLEADVSGLTSPGLDIFDLTLGTLPSGVSLTSTTDLLSNWYLSSNVGAQSYGGTAEYNSNDPGSGGVSDDLVGSAKLVDFNFTVNGTPSAGTINFAAPGVGTQDMYDENFDAIAFSQSGASIVIAPEPPAWLLIGAGLFLIGAATGRRWKKRA